MKTSLWITVLVICLSASVLLQRWIDAQRGAGSAVEEALYLKSGKTLKQASLGFVGIMADLYWLRTIQYFGGKSQQAGSCPGSDKYAPGGRTGSRSWGSPCHGYCDRGR